MKLGRTYFRLVWGAILFTFLCSPGCFSAHQKDFYREGLFSLQSGDCQAAKKNFQQAVASSPQKTAYLNSLAIAYQCLENFKSAEFYLQKTLRIDSQNISALINLGNLYLRLNNPDQAKELFLRAKEVDPYNASLLNSFGIMNYQIGSLSEAQDNFNASARTQGRTLALRLNLANTLLAFDLVGEARKILSELTKEQKPSQDLLDSQKILKALIDFRKSNYSVSIKNFTDVLAEEKLDPYCRYFLLYLRGYTWRKLGLYNESNEDYHILIDLIQANKKIDKNIGKLLEAEANFYLGLNCLDMDRFDESKDFFQKAENSYQKIVSRKKEVNLYSQLVQGIILELNGNLPQALERFGKVLEIEPLNFRALYHLGVINLLEKKYDLAQEYLRKVVALNPYSSNVHNLLGVTNFFKSRECEPYYRGGYFAQAEQEYRLALEYEPQNRTAYDNLFLLYRVKRETDKALNLLIQMTKLWPNRPELYSEMGFLLYQMGKNSNALWAFSQIQRLDPGSFEAKAGRELIQEGKVERGKN
jgi:tetratricopeptide (TPR) repeat protein